MRNVMHSRIVQFPRHMRAGGVVSGPMLGTQATEMVSAAGELTAVYRDSMIGCVPRGGQI